ncbi:MAG: hypothetical protein ACK4I8_05620 [Armatimonadota bacterium]
MSRFSLARSCQFTQERCWGERFFARPLTTVTYLHSLPAFFLQPPFFSAAAFLVAVLGIVPHPLASIALAVA